MNTDSGDTPLVEAVKGENVKIVEFLIKQGAKISLANVEGFTPLHFAVLNSQWFCSCNAVKDCAVGVISSNPVVWFQIRWSLWNCC